MVPKPKAFFFTTYTADWDTGTLTFSYRTELEDGIRHDFTETLQIPGTIDRSRAEHPSVLRVCEMIHMTLGVSYFKMFGPTEIIHPYAFSPEQARYWELLYTQGLGEYYYTNQLDFEGLVHVASTGTSEIDTLLPLRDRALILHGGGKDSIVSVEIAKKAGIDFDLFAINEYDIQKSVAEVIGKQTCSVKRTVDQHMIDLNKEGNVYNGHVPISAVYASVAFLYALLFDYAYVVVSNERSAVYGNVQYKGMMVNHQWSKSQEFESVTRAYLAGITGKQLEFFSLLRPLYEIRIAQLFSRFPQYFEVFSSSNHNFTIDQSGKKRRWNTDFSKGKVEFVWALLSAYLPKDDMLRIFEEDIYSRLDCLEKFQELLGMKDIKPLDCVGTPEEMIVAMYHCMQRGEWNDTPIMRYFIETVLPLKQEQIDDFITECMSYDDDSHIPAVFTSALSAILKEL